MPASTDLQNSIHAQNGFRHFNPIVTKRLKEHFINREQMYKDEIDEVFQLIHLEQSLSTIYVLQLEFYSL